MTTTTRLGTMQAAREAAGADFQLLAAGLAGNSLVPADGTLRNAWLAAYAARFADLAEPCTIENALVADGRAPRFYAGQRVRFTASFADFALHRGTWEAGEVTRYLGAAFQPLPSVSQNLRLFVRAIGKRSAPIGKLIEVAEFQVREAQEAEVSS